MPDKIIDELRRLRAQMVEIAASLRSQHALLSRRGLGLSEEILAGLAELETGLEQLSAVLEDEAVEIEQLWALARTSALINSSLDIDVLLARSMDEIIKLTGAERGLLLMKNGRSGQLEIRIARGAEASSAGLSRTILNEVMRRGQPLLTDNAVEDPRIQPSETVAHLALRSVMCVPLIFRDQINGAIYIDNRLRAGVFRQRDLNLLTAFANQMGIAIDNALLFEQIGATLAEITRVKDLLENVFASIGSGVVTTGADDRVATFNRAAERILALPADQAVGRPLAVLAPRLRADLEAQARHARESDERVAIEAQPLIEGRGRVVLNLKLSPLKNGSRETQGVAMVIDDLTAQREREETLDLVRRYLPPGMVDQIHTIADLEMGGERREVTCAFIYACRYDAFPPGLRPAEMMALLNIYLETATAVIHEAQGVIDKYMGNEIMVLFNTQLNPMPRHALRAVQMALDLCDAFALLRQQLGEDHAGQQCSVGIHTGTATLGNVGGLSRRNFTAIGDTINLAKRIQEYTQPGELLLSEATLLHVQATAPAEALAQLRWTEREPLQARGRQQITQLYEVARV